jgi:hypothetical protein
MSIESLGKCYIKNIHDVLGQIELNGYGDEDYVKVMKELKYEDPRKKNQKE